MSRWALLWWDMIRSTEVRGTAASAAVRRREEQARRAEQGALAIGLVGLFLGGCGWLAGARYTVDGWILFLNQFLSWLFSRFEVTVVIPIPTWWVYLLLMGLLGYFYSRVELDYVPLSWPGNWRRGFANLQDWYIAPWQIWAIFFVIIASDVGTTYMGIQNPPKDSWKLMSDVAKSGGLSGLLAIIITFLPDRLIRWSWRRLKRLWSVDDAGSVAE